MSIKIGIPRGLFFYEYYTLWKEFFNELGIEVVLSKPTNKKILDDGVSVCVDEACLPVKVYHGHVINLKDKVDFLFIPKLISVHKKEYNCPKILGLPEMIMNSIENLPPIIDTKINLRKSNRELNNSVNEIAKCLDLNKKNVKNALKNSLIKYRNHRTLVSTGVVPIDAIKMYNKLYKTSVKDNKKKMTLMVIGHSYNIYDDFLSMNLIEKLKKQNITVITPEMVNLEKVDLYASNLTKRMFWTAGRKIIGSSFYMLEENQIDGMIYISSFGCGLDSVLVDLVQRKAKKSRIPFTLLTLDEHSGEAGVNTRVEAFIDMIRWRYKDENYFSTHG